ncbi:MAG TPA: acyltransferase domain-containing protein [Beutenbergiaceae bacterium]|nr:acyltransferase domain-containing protein [Beutenbergiaceae bacterium]
MADDERRAGGGAPVAASVNLGDLDRLSGRLGFCDEDRRELLGHAAQLTPADWADVDRAATALRGILGQWDMARPDVFADFPDQEGRPRGLIPMLALLRGVPAVREYHARRGIAEADTIASLADLGQQAWVYRQVFNEFGLDTQGWLTTAWAGAFFWLGRLQFNLLPFRGQHVISVHIPQTGPLPPEEVDEAFGRAWRFFDTHFPDAPATAFHCDSWLLDPRLSQVLHPQSNLARFQRRWRLINTGKEADASVLYFVFRHRPRPGEQLDRRGLPRRTSLERAVLDHLDAGGHWYSYTGLIDP